MEQSSEQSTDQSMDQDDDGRWLTYPELSAVRGIDKPSAIRLATRKKWRRQRDNHRVVRVLVPPEWMSPRYQSMDQPMERRTRDMDRPMDQQGRSMDLSREQKPRDMDWSTEQQSRDMDRSSDQAGFTAAFAAVEAAHAGEIAALHGQIAGLKVLADTVTAQLADANAARAAALEQAERVNAVRAGFEADLRTKDAEIAEQRLVTDQARREVREAQEAAEKLRHAEEARKARGRLRRAWDGWRGR